MSKQLDFLDQITDTEPQVHKLLTFTFRSELYIRAIPGKNLFRSSMVHEVVNRGDIFAVRVRDSCLTIIPGTAEVEHSELEVTYG